MLPLSTKLHEIFFNLYNVYSSVLGDDLFCQYENCTSVSEYLFTVLLCLFLAAENRPWEKWMLNYRWGEKELCKIKGKMGCFSYKKNHLRTQSPFSKTALLVDIYRMLLVTNRWPRGLASLWNNIPEFCVLRSGFILFPSVCLVFLFICFCEPEIHFASAPPLSTPLSPIQYQTLLRAFVLSL